MVEVCCWFDGLLLVIEFVVIYVWIFGFVVLCDELYDCILCLFLGLCISVCYLLLGVLLDCGWVFLCSLVVDLFV